MKVLHYIPSIDRASGGVGAYMQLLAKELGKLTELHVVTHHSENELTLENCIVHYIGTGWMPWSSTKKRFYDLLASVNPDVFHSNCCWLPLSAYTAMWAKTKGYKVVYTPHGMLEPWILSRNYYLKKKPAIFLFQKKGIAVADVVHLTAESEKRNFLQLGWNLSTCVVPNCVDIQEIDTQIRKVNVIRKKTILFLSRIHVKKGLEFLIEAVAILKEQLKGWVIKIAGEGDDGYVEKLRGMAKDLGVADMIQFVGGVYGEKKWELYGAASLFVLPTHSENFGIVVAEALACGIPVITTKGTPWEDLVTSHCGWWTEIGTQPSVEALKEFLSKTDTELSKMGDNGRQLVRERYSSSAIARQFLKMYSQL